MQDEANTLKVAAVQMVSATDPAVNMAAAARLIAQAAGDGARVVVLPEYFCLLGRKDTDKVAIREADGDGPLQAFLAEQAARHAVWLIGGTVPLASARPSRVRNACLVYGPEGTRRARYDKIHLFGLDRGGERFDESATIEAGRTPVVCDVGPWRIGLSVCYDVRFPELYRRLVAAGAQLLSIPAAFTLHTGKDHWHVLLRARAIENQCFVLAAAQQGRHSPTRFTYGHSLIVDPWGTVLCEVPDGEGVAVAELDFASLQKIRTDLPSLAHRRIGVES